MNDDSSELQDIRHVLLDMDGTIYLGDHLFEWTIPFLELLTRRGVGWSFLTNNTSRSRADYVQKLERLGIRIHPRQMLTPARAVADYLDSHPLQVNRLHVLGTPSLQEEMASLGYTLVSGDPDDEPDAVVVAFDTTLSYERLCQTAWWIQQGKLYIATHPDRTCPTNESTVLLDCGAICSALEAATGIKPHDILGKPNPFMVRQLCEEMSIRPGEIAVIGDRLMTDIAMARNVGAKAVLVLSGEAKRGDLECSEWLPDLVVENLSELHGLFEASCQASR